MRLRLAGLAGGVRSGRRLLASVLLGLLLIAGAVSAIGSAQAAEAPAATPPPAAAPAMDNAMSSAGWLQNVFLQLEREAMSDVSMLPDTPGAVAREWRTFDRDGSALGALINVGWVVLAACLALLAERCVARGLSRRVRRAMRVRG